MDVADWVARYERLWRTAGTDELGTLFTVDATYRASPWAEPVVGLAAIEQLWEDERDTADEPFTLLSQVVAVDGATAVVRVAVDYLATGHRWRDLWVLEFDSDGLCASFEEWPFAPDQTDGH